MNHPVRARLTEEQRATIVKAGYRLTAFDATKATKADVAHIEGILLGIGIIAADVLHIAGTPWGFVQAVKKSVDIIGTPRMRVAQGSPAEKAQQQRTAWEYDLIATYQQEVI